MLLIDLKGSITHFKLEGDLYEQPDDLPAVELWDEAKVEVLKNEEVKKSEYQMDLDGDVDTEAKDYNFVESVQEWSDFICARYHPRSVNVLQDFSHEVNETGFDTFALGTETWREQADFEDKIRNYIEECDCCQGFQVLFDVDDGFSGLATKCAESLQDTFGKPLVCVPIFAPRSRQFKNTDAPMSDSIRLMNIALAYSHLSEVSSVFIPLSTMERGWRALSTPRTFPWIDFQAQNFYQSAAVLATYLDTLSLRYRLKGTPSYVAGLCTELSWYDRKMLSAGLALPLAVNEEDDLIDCLDKLEGPLFQKLSPNAAAGTDYVVQSLVVRGIPAPRLKKPREKASHKQMQMAAYSCASVSEMLQLYYQCSYHSSMAHVTAAETGLQVKKPFPREIFSSNLSATGFVAGQERTTGDIRSLPVLATAQNSSKLGNTLDGLYRDVKRIKFNKIHRFRQSNLEQVEYEESLERLLNFKENYDDGFQL